MKRNILPLFFALLCSETALAQGIFRVSPKRFNVDGAYEFNPKYFTPMDNGKMYFFATDQADGFAANQLWITEGTWATTKKVKTINNYFYSTLHDMASIPGAVVFFDSRDTSLWRSDGTEVGTVKIKKIGGKGFFAFNNKLFFEGIDNTTGNKQIWITDGTTDGTLMLADIGKSNYGGFDGAKIVFNNKLYFAVAPVDYEYQLWSSDGTALGTKLVKDCNPSGRDAVDYFVIMNNELYFSAYYTGSSGNSLLKALWKTDGTGNGTTVVYKATFPDFFFIADMIPFNNKLYMVSQGDLWSSDGTGPGTSKINMDTTGKNKSFEYISLLTELNGKLYCRAYHYSNGYQLAVLNSSFNGLQELPSGKKDLNPVLIRKFKDGLMFLAKPDPYISEYNQLWYTNGTDTGTKMVIPPSYSNNKGITFFDFGKGDYNFYKNDIYFRANYDHILGYQLFKFTLDSVSKLEPNLAIDGSHVSKILVYPNPTNGKIFVADDKPIGEVLLFNHIGQVVYQKSILEDNMEINIESPGIYYLRLGGGTETRKIVVQK